MFKNKTKPTVAKALFQWLRYIKYGIKTNGINLTLMTVAKIKLPKSHRPR